MLTVNVALDLVHGLDFCLPLFKYVNTFRSFLFIQFDFSNIHLHLRLSVFHLRLRFFFKPMKDSVRLILLLLLIQHFIVKFQIVALQCEHKIWLRTSIIDGSIARDNRWTTKALFNFLFDFFFVSNIRFCLFSIVEMVNCARFFFLHHTSLIHFLPARNIRYFFWIFFSSEELAHMCDFCVDFFPSFVRLHDYIFIFRF